MIVIFTETAQRQMREIYRYHADVVSVSVAEEIKEAIIGKIELLSDFPEMGQLDFILEDLQREYRYVIEGNYKIVYRKDNFSIIINAIFDTRRDPRQLTKELK